VKTQADKTQQNTSKAIANNSPKQQGEGESVSKFENNRTDAMQMRSLREMVNNSPQVKQLKAYQGMANSEGQVAQLGKNLTPQQSSSNQHNNRTGLPDHLKLGIENLSGYSMDDVKVYYNSERPSQLKAYAFAQGSDIHLSSGQEKHLAHEAWHVVQQKQGKVKPTLQMKGKVNVNDDAGLEHEADVMGQKAIQAKNEIEPFQLKKTHTLEQGIIQCNRGFLTGTGKSKFIEHLIGSNVLKLEEFNSLDTTGKSVTLLNQDVVKLIIVKIKAQYPERGSSTAGTVTSQSQANQGQVAQEEPSNEIKNLVQELQDLKSERENKIPNEEAENNMGIDPVNLAAIKKILKLRDESIIVRPVGEGTTALQAANHQRANLPTKPFSIKLKSELDTGFIPINQFNDNGSLGEAPMAKAFRSLTDKASALTNKYIIHQLETIGARPTSATITKVLNLLHPEGSATSVQAEDNLTGHLEPDDSVKEIDNHISATGQTIISKAGLSEAYLSKILNGKESKSFLVDKTTLLPIVGDYDIYRIFTKDALVNEPLTTIEGAGDSNSFVMGAAIDYNVSVALSGYTGGLVFHHGAEMHNENFAQPKGSALAIDENFRTQLAAPNEGYDTANYTALKLHQGAHTSVRPSTAKAVRVLADQAYPNPSNITNALPVEKKATA